MLGGEFQGGDGNEHWIHFKNKNIMNEKDGSFYFTLKINLENDIVSLYSLGLCLGINKCNEGYLNSTLICDSSIPFTVGVGVGGVPTKVSYSKFLLYGCRLYDRVLSDEEIKLNYNESKSLLEN